MNSVRFVSLFLGLILGVAVVGQTTGFSYQGRLQDKGIPASGTFDVRSRLFDAGNGGSQTGPTLTNEAVVVSGGLFAMQLDFGAGIFTGGPRFLELAVRPAGSDTFTLLNPRQALTPAPYALHAMTPAGPKGDKGDTGAEGPVGPAGPIGPKGDKGDTGAEGPAGPVGPLGPKGDKGDTGAEGPAGPVGSIGPKGDKGDIGVQGPAGPAGPIGPKGDKGDIGARGPVGPVGPVGPIGPIGPIGPKGDKGDTGAPGPIGPPGSNDAWSRTGNAGTVSSVDFLGTTDANPLIFRANNRQVLRLESSVAGPRLIVGVGNSIDPSSTNSSILGGRANLIAGNAHESTIAGGQGNEIQSPQRGAFIGGGARNQIRVDNDFGMIAGGRDNRIGTNSVISLVVGGGENVIGNNVDGALMGGGFRNDILGSADPFSRQIAPILLGGSDNEIGRGRGSSWAVILGGDNNRIGTNCPNAIILGGTNNLVADNAGFSLAAGRRARVNHVGSFVWGDSQNASFPSAGDDTFNIRAKGGVHLSGQTSLSFGNTTRQMVNLWGNEYGVGVQNFTVYFRSGGNFSWYTGGSHNDDNGSAGGGSTLMRLSNTGLRVNGTFVSSSDRNKKENFKAVSPRQILDQVVELPVCEWNYKADPKSRHIGPMAQDFKASFGLGDDDKFIATVDADGVALAAIKGLNQKLEETVRAQETRLAHLEAELAELRRLIRSSASAGVAALPVTPNQSTLP